MRYLISIARIFLFTNCALLLFYKVSSHACGRNEPAPPTPIMYRHPSLARHIVFWLLAGFLLISSSCQHNSPRSESERTDSLLTILSGEMFANPHRVDSALTRLQGTLADSANWYKVQVYRGTAHSLMPDSIGAARIYGQVSAWCRRSGRGRQVEGLMNNHWGIKAMFRGDMPRARRCFEKAFKLLDCPPKGQELISATTNLADFCFQSGDLPHSAFYYRYALYLCDSLGQNRDRTAIYCGLAQTYTELENFPEAHHYFDLAGKHINRESIQTRFFYHSCLGNCLYFEQRYEEALFQFKQSLTLAMANSSAGQEYVCEGNMAEICLMTNRLPEARRHLERFSRLQKERGGVSPLIASYIESLKIDLALAEGRAGNGNRHILQNADSLLAASPRYLKLHYSRLEHYAVRDRLWRKAYNYRVRSDKYGQKLRDLQSRNNVNEMALRYHRDTTLLHQRLIMSDLRSRNMRQQSYVGLAVASAIVLALAATLVMVIYRRRTQRRFKRQMEKINELRMDIVRNRVSPHYIFNVLGTILPKLQGHPDLATPVDMLIDVLRGNLLTSGKLAVSLADELALVRRYVSLYHYSNGARPSVTWDVDESLAAEDFMIPSMALQIPVENALKHAFPTLTDESAIHVTVRREGQSVLLRVTDNGCGYTPGRVQPTGRDTGTGLRLLSRTIAILNQYNRHSARLSIANLAAPLHGTGIELHLPVGYSFALPGKD